MLRDGFPVKPARGGKCIGPCITRRGLTPMSGSVIQPI